MKNKIAIIDMGTNTFHLLLAEPEGTRFNITRRDRLAVKMGMGGINQGVITEAGIHRALLAMRSFKNTADDHGVKKIYAYGTSALRNASNQREVTRRIKALTDIEVNIIDGLQEADFIYHGVKAALDMEKEKSLIIDIGGGSVEFIIADNHEIFWKESIEIGAQRLLEEFQQNDPITPEEMASLDQHFKESLGNLFVALQQYATVTMVGSSGTFDTLSDIFCIRHDIHKSPEEAETPLSIPGFHEIYLDLIHKPRTERLLIPGMIEMRVDMIVVACCLIRYILEQHPFTRIRVSTYSLKEGVLATLINEMKLMV
ncbi:MAG TPA: exopolyphosphatase [Ohtaekwangia sp.]|nr:exopolyphosphatase [Ohtaekwangia sp.]